MNFDIFPIRLIFFTLLLWPVTRVWLRFKEGSVKLGEFLFWTAVWIAGVFVIFFPDFLTFLADTFGVGRGSDLAIYLALTLLFYLVFRTNVTVENVKHEISRLVREIALKEEASLTKPNSKISKDQKVKN